MIPGQYQLQEGDIELCAGRERISVEVANTGAGPFSLAPTTTLLKPTPRWCLTAIKPVAIGWTSPQAPPFASSLAKPAKSR